MTHGEAAWAGTAWGRQLLEAVPALGVWGHTVTGIRLVFVIHSRSSAEQAQWGPLRDWLRNRLRGVATVFDAHGESVLVLYQDQAQALGLPTAP